jgi:hypothetical protein
MSVIVIAKMRKLRHKEMKVSANAEETEGMTTIYTFDAIAIFPKVQHSPRTKPM